MTDNLYTRYQSLLPEEKITSEIENEATNMICITDTSLIDGKAIWTYFITDMQREIIEEEYDIVVECPMSSFRAERIGLQ